MGLGGWEAFPWLRTGTPPRGGAAEPSIVPSGETNATVGRPKAPHELTSAPRSPIPADLRGGDQNSSIPGIGGADSSGLSTTTASVVRNRAAMEAAFCRPARVTLAASMTPSENMSAYSSVAALYP